MDQDFLTRMLSSYWFAPPVALWRAIELRVAAWESFDRPLLDLGCGDGLIAQALFGSDGSVDVGFDPWMAQLLRARHTSAYRHLDCASGQQLPYGTGLFATAFSNSVLEHIPDALPVIREAARVLRSGGRLIFTVPSDHFRELLDGYTRRANSGDLRGAEAYADKVDTYLAHRHYYSPSQWRYLLSKCGLEMERAQYYVPGEVVQLWDRTNRRFGIGRARSVWSVLASPRLENAGYQQALRRLVIRRLGAAWRQFYEMDVADGQVGGGLLVVARKVEG